MKDFLGQGGFFWWHGVVEDVKDPLMLGRVRARVFGYHSEKMSDIQTKDLPWAYPMQPITSAALSGIGTSPTGLLVGSHVFGFFRDGEEGQDPVVIGSFGGIPRKPPEGSAGFYPMNFLRAEGVSKVDEPDTNRLARNELTENSIVAKKTSSLTDSVSSVSSMGVHAGVWGEPPSPYNATYPKNHVRFTESGNVEEFDDTPGAERIHHYHCSGTFSEMGNGYENDPNGTKVDKIIGNHYEICLGNKKIYVQGTEGLDIVLNGDMNVTIGAAANIQITGNANLLVNGNVNLSCEKDIKASGRNVELFAGQQMALSGSSISFISDGIDMVLGGGQLRVNSGPAIIRPTKNADYLL